MKGVHRMDKTQGVKVNVTFPLGHEGPYQHTSAPETTVAQILAAAMAHFGVQPEPNVDYYLTAHGERQELTATVGDIAGHAEAVAFRLIKEITQG
jgi:hypothetical protein